MGNGCVFCAIANGEARSSVVYEDAHTVAFVDLRQFHPGHTLVVPRQHFGDVRDLDHPAGAALMATVALVSRAVSSAFPNQGLSVWHSAGEAAFQEIEHLHFHVHPRLLGDQLLRIYPSSPETPDRRTLDVHAATLRSHLTDAAAPI